ncbi:protein phosphatase 2C [Trypanosoma rangeli SC58]|uniref:Protein phosphatase 2C n=1 Tax=Trypanosoma rangeli SC58 TaxID=429131 RepID=A0A061JAV6_TRYRA|nr:protein phosphatase 2C [Trypanosoma rangeli SC58]
MSMFQAFPLQHKKMSRLLLPFLSVGVCEVLNCATRDHMSSFTVHNTRNRGAHVVMTGSSNSGLEAAASSSISCVPFMSEAVAGGLCDSFTGNQCSRYIGSYLARALGFHTVLSEGIAQLRRELKDDPIIDIMMSAIFCERLLQSRKSHAGKDTPPGFCRVFSEREMQQYAMFADNAFMNACRKGEAAGGFIENDALQNSVAANSGCRAVWFTASVAPFSLHETQCEGKHAVRRGAAAPLSRQGEAKAIASKNTENERGAAPPTSPFCLDVLVSNVGDSRAFGIARHTFPSGFRDLWDATREPVVPLSSDHKPLRTQELRRIIAAGGVVRSDVGKYH